MDMHDLTRQLKISNDSKIVLLVSDGLGGLPLQPGGRTELETAHHPNLDALATRGVSGLQDPVKPGIAPGSGPGHLGLFGYDPLKYEIGRGALEATGIGFPLRDGDIAMRGNYCTLDANGLIVDRRASRIPTEESAPLAKILQTIELPGVEVFVEPVREYRFVVVLRGSGLSDNLQETDPQVTGAAPLPPTALDEASTKTSELVTEFIRQARVLLKTQPKANGLTLRGFATTPHLPSYQEVYGLRAAAIAVYPMYKGLAHLVGMNVIGKAQTLADQMAVLREAWNEYDFFFIHYKYTDAAGEDGNFDAKVKRIEELDAAIPAIEALNPTVLMVTGDHSTPAKLRSHSWHPVPVVLSADSCRTDACTTFSESAALTGGLGRIEAKYLMPLALAHAGRLTKFGA
ncbi:MAG: 2,3-bisphosphoglycerate-independent phosphoglycerate mutase [Vicinamibacterales bacterium]